jgi:hypothetical protein
LVEVFLRAIDLGTVSKLRYFSDQKSLDIVDYNPIGAFQFNLLHRISIGYPKYINLLVCITLTLRKNGSNGNHGVSTPNGIYLSEILVMEFNLVQDPLRFIVAKRLKE